MARIGIFGSIGLAAAVISTVGLVGCGSSSNDQPESRVRVLNAALSSNGGQPVDVIVNGQRYFTNVGFGATSTRLQIPAGTQQTVVVQQAGTGVDMGTSSVDVTRSVDQTLLVTGIPNGSGGQQYRVIALPPEDLSATPVSTQSRVYFVNAATNTTATSSTASFAYGPTGGATTTLSGVNFGEMTAAQLPNEGAYTISANVGGQTVSTTTTLQGGKSYTVLLAGRTTAAGGVPALNLQVIVNN